MTTPDPWDDARLVAAFEARARVQGAAAPLDLAEGVVMRIRARPAPPMRRGGAILASAALLAAVLVVAIGTGPWGPTVPRAPGDMAPRAEASATGSTELTIIGVERAIDIREGGIDSRELAVRGWFSPHGPISCPYTLTTSPLQPDCPDQYVVLMAEPESLVTVDDDGFAGRVPSGPSIQLELDGLDGAWQPGLPSLGPAEPVEIVVVGHFDDRRSAWCPGDEQQVCRDRFVVDRVDRADGIDQPLSVAIQVEGEVASTLDRVLRQIPADIAAGDVLSVVVTDGAAGLIGMEPALGGGQAGITDQDVVWVVRALDGDLATTFLVIDGADVAYEMPPDGPLARVDTAAASTAAPWAPEGALMVELTSEVPAGQPPAQVAVVDLSGWLDSARAVSPDDRSPDYGPGADPAPFVGEGPGEHRLRWMGDLCDGQLIVTIEAEVRRIVVDRGRQAPCGPKGIWRELILRFTGPVSPATTQVIITTQPVKEATDALPTEVVGLDVMDIDAALEIQARPGDDRVLAVAGWYWRDPTLLCFAPAPERPLLDSGCPDSADRLVEGPDANLIDAATFRPVVGAWLRDALPAPWWSAQVILIGHFDDRRASACTPDRQTACGDAFFVDALWSAGVTVGEWTISASGEPAPSGTHAWARAIAQGFGGEDGDTIAVGLVAGVDLASLEPATAGNHITSSHWIWHVTTIDRTTGATWTHMIADSAFDTPLDHAVYKVVGDNVEGYRVRTIID